MLQVELLFDSFVVFVALDVKIGLPNESPKSPSRSVAWKLRDGVTMIFPYYGVSLDRIVSFSKLNLVSTFKPSV
jgi:hypothetical protein